MLGSAYQVSITPPVGSSWPAEWYQDAPSRDQGILLPITVLTPLHLIEVRLG